MSRFLSLPSVFEINEIVQIAGEPHGKAFTFGTLPRCDRTSIGFTLVSNDYRIEVGRVHRVVGSTFQSLSNIVRVVSARGPVHCFDSATSNTVDRYIAASSCSIEWYGLPVN